MADKRIKDLTNTATESDIASGNYIALDGSAGTKKLNSTTLLTKTAQNALAGNVAMNFDATRTASNKYTTGDKVVYNGKVQSAVEDHFGAYSSAHFGDFCIETGNTTVYGSVNLYIDNSFNAVANSDFFGTLVKVSDKEDILSVINPNNNNVIRFVFLTSNSLVGGSPAPIAEKIIHVLENNQSTEVRVPSGTAYIYFWTYTKLGVTFKLSSSGKPLFYELGGRISSAGVIESVSNYTTYVFDVTDYSEKFIKFKLSNNLFTIAYACNETKIDVGSSLDLFSDSKIGIFIRTDDVYVPIPIGVNYIVMSTYTGDGGGVISYEMTEKREKDLPKFNVHTIDSTIPATKNLDVNGGCFCYGDEMIVSMVGTFNAGMSDVKLMLRLAAGYTDEAYLRYGFLKFTIKTPVFPNFRFVFGSISGVISYTIKLGYWQNYNLETFRFASINAGCFDHGETTSPTTPDAEGDAFVDVWQTMLKAIGADVIGFCEWNNKMTTTSNYPPKRKLLNCYQNVKEKVGDTGSGYNKKAIASIYESKDEEYVVYTDQGSEIPRAFFYEKIQLNGKEIYIVETHLELIAAYRALQIAELISFFNDKDYVVIGGDFNAADASEYVPFTEAGYDIANCGMWGLEPTYIGNSISPASDTAPPDNIVVKGLKIKNIGYYSSTDCTDHKAIFADIYFIDK